jgi:hypothetical protein
MDSIFDTLTDDEKKEYYELLALGVPPAMILNMLKGAVISDVLIEDENGNKTPYLGED